MLENNNPCVPMEGSSLLGFCQLKVTVLPVIDSITGGPSGGSGRISEKIQIIVSDTTEEMEVHPKQVTT